MSDEPYVLRLEAAVIEEQIWELQRAACLRRARATWLEEQRREQLEEWHDLQEFERVSGLRIAS